MPESPVPGENFRCVTGNFEGGLQSPRGLEIGQAATFKNYNTREDVS